MNRRPALLELLTYFIALLVMILTFTDATFRLVEIKYDHKTVVIIAALSLLYLFIISYIKYTWISLVLLFIIPKPFYLYDYIKKLVAEAPAFFGSVVEHQSVVTEYAKYFIDIAYVLLPVLALIYFYIGILKKSALVLIVLGSALFSVCYLIGSNDIYGDCVIYLLFNILLYGLNNYVEKRYEWVRRKSTVGRNHFTGWILLLAVLLILTNFTIKFLPRDFKPVSFEWLQKKAENQFKNIKGRNIYDYKYFPQNPYNISFSGFQDQPGRLGGRVVLDYSTTMRIYSKDRINGLHIRGAIRYNYNGYIWSKNAEVFEKTSGEVDVDELNISYENKSIRIYPLKMETDTAFNALYPYLVSNRLGTIQYDYDKEIYNPGIVGNGGHYDVSFREYNITSRNLESGYDYRKNPKELDKKVLERYLLVPNELPKRVRELTAKITAGSKNEYQRAAAIEKYLKKNYPYDLNTSLLPRGRDFVDYFLFDEKKGSCTYFASAMAVMCRLSGIPTRYVEGFVVPETPSKNGNYDIPNSNAHAWVELYFKNIGWVTFDPTPGSNAAGTDVTRINSDGNTSPDPTKTNGEVRQKENNEGVPKQSTQEKQQTSKTPVKVNPFAATLVIALLIILLMILYYVFQESIAVKRGRVLEYTLKKLIQYGSYAGVDYKKGDTVREYISRLGGILNLKLDKYIELYEKANFSADKITEKDMEAILRSVHRTRNEIIKKRGYIRFYIWDFRNSFKLNRVKK